MSSNLLISKKFCQCLLYSRKKTKLNLIREINVLEQFRRSCLNITKLQQTKTDFNTYMYCNHSCFNKIVVRGDAIKINEEKRIAGDLHNYRVEKISTQFI